MKLDYTIKDPEERLAIVEEILSQEEEPSSYLLESLANYLVLAKKDSSILTDNRQITISNREKSYEGLAAQFEAGEDAVTSLAVSTETARHTIFKPKKVITKEDIEEIPFLKQVREAISFWDSLPSSFITKKAIIELRKDQYIIKNAFKPLTNPMPHAPSYHPLHLDGYEEINQYGILTYHGVSLCNPKIVSIILNYYSTLREKGEGDFEGDTWSLIQDFDHISSLALKDRPAWERLVELKIDKVSNAAIKDIMETEYNEIHNESYWSNLWQNRIPELIAEKAREEAYYFLYQSRPFEWKICGRCGQNKPLSPFFYSKNKRGYYSICKKCRSGVRDLKDERKE